MLMPKSLNKPLAMTFSVHENGLNRRMTNSTGRITAIAVVSGEIKARRLGIRSENSTNSVVTNTNDSVKAMFSRPGPV